MKKAMIAITAFLLAVTLSGCGKTDDSLEQYKTDMTAFTDKINELATSIDNIDVDSDTRTEELLGYLDEMDAAFIEMGSLEVPDHEQFANIEELADEASANLSNLWRFTIRHSIMQKTMIPSWLMLHWNITVALLNVLDILVRFCRENFPRMKPLRLSAKAMKRTSFLNRKMK